MFDAYKEKVAASCLLCLLLMSCAHGVGGVYDAAETGARPNGTPRDSAGKAKGSQPEETARAAAAIPGEPQATDATTADASANRVVIENFAFKPATLTVKAGATVTWINRDDVPHTATENDRRFNSGALDTDGQFSYAFKTAGTYRYFCALHPKMTGQVVVTK